MYINFHDHLQLYENLDQAFEQMENYDIHTLACSMNLKEYLEVKKLAENRPYIKKGLGIHPFKVKEDSSLENFEPYIKEADFLGEIGIDYHWAKDKKAYPRQREIFQYFIEMAKKYKKPTNIHTKAAEKEILERLERVRPKNPIIHWYEGELDLVKRYLDIGSYFTIGVDSGLSEMTDQLIRYLPLDRILTETDGPGSLSWVQKKKGYPKDQRKIAMPSYIIEIVRYIGKIKGLEEEKVRESIENSYRKIFS